MEMIGLAALAIFAAIASGFFILQVLRKNVHIWLPTYLAQTMKRKPMKKREKPIHIVFSLVDHFEPQWNKPSLEIERERVNYWVQHYPEMARGHFDADGRCPQHTWFYPQEEYRAEHLEKLSNLCSQGYGEIELHLHHDNDTSQGLRQKIEQAKSLFSKHGALVSAEGSFAYGFIHGNWSLDNSRRDGRWCGVNDELLVLKATGCYADFTMPSAPSETQTRKINGIYYATDDPNKPKSHDSGVDVEVGGKPAGDLMVIQGPLCPNWKNRARGVFPRIENGGIMGEYPPTADRIAVWIKQHIHVKGMPNWVFVKTYTHGAQEGNHTRFFGRGGMLDVMYSHLEETYNDGKRYVLHYVTAREMYNIIKAAEAGETGDPNLYRNYLIPPYANCMRRGGRA